MNQDDFKKINTQFFFKKTLNSKKPCKTYDLEHETGITR